jgi:hypothetical protein
MSECVLPPEQRWQGLIPDASEDFVEDLARDATDFATLAVFADWLEEHGHTKLGERFRRLMPKDGDVLVYSYEPSYSEALEKVRQCATEVRDRLLKDFGLRTAWIVKPADLGLDILDADSMHALGWMRIPQVDPPTISFGTGRSAGATTLAPLAEDPDLDAHDNSPASSAGPSGQAPGPP